MENIIVIEEKVILPETPLCEQTVTIPCIKGDKGDPLTYDDLTPELIPDVSEEEQPIPEMTYEEQVVAKIRERYSINDELALLRQKDTKTSEFQAYYQYVEECKSNIKAN